MEGSYDSMWAGFGRLRYGNVFKADGVALGTQTNWIWSGQGEAWDESRARASASWGWPVSVFARHKWSRWGISILSPIVPTSYHQFGPLRWWLIITQTNSCKIYLPKPHAVKGGRLGNSLAISAFGHHDPSPTAVRRSLKVDIKLPPGLDQTSWDGKYRIANDPMYLTLHKLPAHDPTSILTISWAITLSGACWMAFSSKFLEFVHMYTIRLFGHFLTVSYINNPVLRLQRPAYMRNWATKIHWIESAVLRIFTSCCRGTKWQSGGVFVANLQRMGVEIQALNNAKVGKIQE